jgi:hypothetical protein
MSAAAAEASNLIQTSCATAAKGAMEYNTMVIEIARANTNAAFDSHQRSRDESPPGSGNASPSTETAWPQVNIRPSGRRG